MSDRVQMPLHEYLKKEALSIRQHLDRVQRNYAPESGLIVHIAESYILVLSLMAQQQHAKDAADAKDEQTAPPYRGVLLPKPGE